MPDAHEATRIHPLHPNQQKFLPHLSYSLKLLLFLQSRIITINKHPRCMNAMLFSLTAVGSGYQYPKNDLASSGNFNVIFGDGRIDGFFERVGGKGNVG
jgi:hypothetical protein